MSYVTDSHAQSSAKVTNSKQGNRWKIAVALVVSSLIGFVAVDILTRLTGLDVPRIWEPDPVVGWHHIPGAQRHFTEEGDGRISINSLGLRDRERSLAKPPGTFRIMALGDSMTEAVQVNPDQTYCHLLEERLSQSDRQVEVLNFGVNGYSPLQELLVLRREAPRYHPDLVTVGVFLDNDVADCHPSLSNQAAQAPFAAMRNGHLEFDYSRSEQSYRDYHRQPACIIREWSATYRWVRSSMAINRRQTANGKDTIPTRFMLYALPCPDVWDEAWSVLQNALLEMDAETKRLGAKLLIISLPCAQVVNRQNWEVVRHQFPAMQSTKWDLERPEKRLREFCGEHGLVLFQPLPDFQKVSNENLFFGNVGHMNARGHRITADLLADFISKNLLVINTDGRTE